MLMLPERSMTSLDVILLNIRSSEVTIDAIDVDLLNMTWNLSKKGGYPTTQLYSKETQLSTPVPMHRIIMARILGRHLQNGEMVDHADNNPLNNRRCNLRLATKAQNAANSRLRRDNLLRLKGVSKNHNRYMANIQYEKQRIYLGTFDTPEEAHAAYIEAAKRYYGEFARWE